MKHVINSEKEYHETMRAIYDLMNKGESNLTSLELKKLAAIAAVAEKYEDKILNLHPLKKL